MSQRSETPFDSIENAHKYIKLLAQTVAETKSLVDDDIAVAGEESSRRVEALHIISYNLEKLQRHLSVSGRALNDLRSLRRLLFAERAPSKLGNDGGEMQESSRRESP